MKKCSCGKIHPGIPKDAKYQEDDFFGGWYWNCACNSPIFVSNLKFKVEINNGWEIRVVMTDLLNYEVQVKFVNEWEIVSVCENYSECLVQIYRYLLEVI